MKKLLYFIIPILLFSFSSCGTYTQEAKQDAPMAELTNGGYITSNHDSKNPITVYSCVPIPKDFSIEDTVHQRMFVIGDNGVISGKQYWDEFYSASLKDQNSKVIIVHYYKPQQSNSTMSQIYIEQLTYTSAKGYTFTTFDESLHKYHYPYLIQVSGRMPNAISATRNYYLVNNPLLTYYQLNWSYLSSNSKDFIPNQLIWFESISQP